MTTKHHSQIIDSASKTAGLPPGTVVYTGNPTDSKVKIELIDYTPTELNEKTVENIEACFPFSDASSVTWLNITGIHDTEIIEKIGAHFDLHPLVMEDIVNTSQRPKIEIFDKHIFIVFKMAYYLEDKKDFVVEQVSLILGQKCVITFQEADKEGDAFDSIRKRIRAGKGRVRKMGCDYLAYALIDAVMDNSFLVLDKIGEELEELEEIILAGHNPAAVRKIHHLKRNLIVLRKATMPMREIISRLEKEESRLISKPLLIYLRDLHEHSIQAIDAIETYRDMLSGTLDIYLSTTSNKLNEIMKVLTIISTIFIPLTFIAGVYGMNFRHMPELEWRYGYYVICAIMAAIGLSMVYYFKRKSWF